MQPLALDTNCKYGWLQIFIVNCKTFPAIAKTFPATSKTILATFKPFLKLLKPFLVHNQKQK